MVQRREMTRTAGVSQKLKYELRASEAVRAGEIFSAHAGGMFSKLVRLQAGSTYTLEMYDGVLT